MPSDREAEDPTREQQHSPQWDFIVSLYAEPDIRDACLALQNMGGIDIPILLAALYASAKQNIRFEIQDIREMDVLVDPLRKNYVLPLRAMRTAPKREAVPNANSGLGELRTKILEAELLAEREQLALLDLYISRKCPQAAGGSNPTDTLKRVCDFYFARANIDESTARNIAPSLEILSKAILSGK